MTFPSPPSRPTPCRDNPSMDHHHSLHILSRTNVVAILLLACLPSTMKGNMGPRWWGNYASEPMTDVKTIEIRHEQLTIDLRPLVSLQSAKVEVIYKLNNPGDVKPCNLVFVS